MNRFQATIAALVFTAAGCGESTPAEPPPNVLLVSMDMLRADHVSAYGYGRKTTPAIDALAGRGSRFAEAISTAPWTLPAHTALFTSLVDSVHGVNDGAGVALAPQVETLAEQFLGEGYATAGFYAGPYLHGAYGLGQGFETYRYCAPYADEYDAADVEAWGSDPKAQRRSHHGATNPLVYGAAEEWLQQVPAGRPFFAFVHLWDAHYDFTPPAPYDTMFTDPAYGGWVTGEEFFFDQRIHAGMDPADLAHLVALYDGEIRWTDAHLRKLLDELERLGRLDNTIVVLVSDHGTELFDHGSKGHRRNLYDESLRVPLVMAGPGVPVGKVFEGQVSLIDVAPTLLDLCGFTAMQGAMGRSLGGLWRGEEWPERDAISELFADGNRLRSVRSKSRKLIHNLANGAHARFDLAGDPLETSSAQRTELEASTDLQALETIEGDLAARRKGSPPPVAPGAVPAGVEGALKANGYVGDGEEER